MHNVFLLVLGFFLLQKLEAILFRGLPVLCVLLLIETRSEGAEKLHETF
jgi:hypothetical protein